MTTPGTASTSDARKRNAEREQSGSFSPTGPTSPTSTYSTTTNAGLPPLPAVGEAATEAEVEAVARALAQMARETIAAMDAVREARLAAKVESLRQAAEVVVLDAGDEATGPEPDPNLAELAHCVAALDAEAVGGVPGRSEAEIKAEALREFADTRGVNIDDEDDDWWRGYRQAQRECLRDAIEAAARLVADGDKS